MPKTFNSTVALQVGFLKHLEDIATVLLDLVCLSLICFFVSFQTDWMMMRSDLCVEQWQQKSHWIITINGKMNVWKCKLIFPTDTLQQKIEITTLKQFLAGENTSVLILVKILVFILATTIYIYIYTVYKIIIIFLWQLFCDNNRKLHMFIRVLLLVQFGSENHFFI